MAGIVKSTKKRFLINKRIKEVDVPTAQLDTDLFIQDLTTIGGNRSQNTILNELAAIPDQVKQEAAFCLVRWAYNPNEVYGMNGDTKSVEPFAFERNSSGTYIAASGNSELSTAGMPRISIGGKTGYLIEKASTNFMPFSGMGNYGALNAVNATDRSRCSSVTESGRTCIRVEEGGIFRLVSMAVNVSEYYTYSFWIKASTPFTLKYSNYSGGVYETVTVQVTTSWQRISKTFLTKTDATGDILHFYNDSGGNIPLMFISDIQFEQGREATSYIPTADSAVTRLADRLTGRRPMAVYPKNSWYLESDIYTGWFGDAHMNLGANNFPVSRIRIDGVDSAVSTITTVQLKLKPSTSYTLSSDIPTAQGLYDLFFHLPGEQPSSSNNGVALDSPRTIVSDIQGNVCVSVRKVYITGLENALWRIKLEEGTVPTAWSACPKDLVKVNNDGTLEVSFNGSAIIRNLSLVPKSIS